MNDTKQLLDNLLVNWAVDGSFKQVFIFVILNGSVQYRSKFFIRKKLRKIKMFHKIDILLIREYYDYGFWLQRKVELWIPGILCWLLVGHGSGTTVALPRIH